MLKMSHSVTSTSSQYPTLHQNQIGKYILFSILQSVCSDSEEHLAFSDIIIGILLCNHSTHPFEVCFCGFIPIFKIIYKQGSENKNQQGLHQAL